MSVSKAKERLFCGESKKICLKKKKIYHKQLITTYHGAECYIKTPCVVTQLLKKNKTKVDQA